MRKMCILSNSKKIPAGRPLFPAYNFSATVAYITYHLGAVTSLKFLVIQNMPSHFSAHVYCGQTARWIKIPLGMEIGLGPGDIALVTQLPLRSGAQQPSLFDPLL